MLDAAAGLPKGSRMMEVYFMRKLLRVILLFLLVGLMLILGSSLALGLYYRNNFPVNTWINGVYCTGKTVEQVNEELSEQTEVPMVTVVDLDGSSWQLDIRQADGRADYTAVLKAYLRQNATSLWVENLQGGLRERMAAGSFAWDEEKLRNGFEELEPVSEAKENEKGVSLEYTDKGYVLRDGNSDRLDVEQAFRYLEECLAKGETYIDLRAGKCYETLEDSRQDLERREIWNQLQRFFDCKIVYDMGAETIPLTPEITSGFLAQDGDGLPVLDASGGIIVDEERVKAWVEELAAAYNTSGTELEFQSSRGDVVSVKYDTYGTELDVEAETAYLTEALSKFREETENHIPAYSRQGFVRGLDDIGGTYIEIDMTEQHMYYYVDGELALDTDVVTGNTGRRMGTPEGVEYVYNKQRNRVLRGPGYASPVKYWMPVRGNVGIHDASWRSNFGGEIYRTNGSHGCINTPSDIMAQLYDMVEIGTPVIMFY